MRLISESEIRVEDDASVTVSDCCEKEQTCGEDVLAVAREIALRRLTLRPHSREELRRAMTKKNVPQPAIEEVLSRFEDVGLIDDEQFAQMWVSSRHANKLHSRQAIRQELQTKGVEGQVIEAALELVDYDSELDAATLLVEKKMRTLGSVDTRVAYRRLTGALARRGYPSEIIAKAIAKVLSDPEL